MSGSTLNKVMLIGHLGDEVKIHYFEGGNSVARFSIATNETYTNKTTGEKVTHTQWHNIVVKNKLAEICEAYLSKGDKIYCEGKLKTSEWETGNDKYLKVEIHVHDINFLSAKRNNTPPKNSNKNINSEGIIEDLPF